VNAGAQDAIDELYSVAPEEFTARRKDLAAAAKKRGEPDAAKRIAAARRPTAAAWVVNSLVRTEETARTRLADLSERLRAAHSAMDGDRIRELSGAQRKLVDELVRAGFAATGMASPSATLRDDVVGTLQAAIADPEVAARLGRLEKAERWSGFGEFGVTAEVATASRRKATTTAAPSTAPAKADERAAAALAEAKLTRDAVAADLATARAAHAAADERVAERRANLVTARRRYEKLLESLSAAEHDIDTAEVERADADDVARSAAEAEEAAKALLAKADSELQRLAASTDSSS
jgi:hypothetical protein